MKRTILERWAKLSGLLTEIDDPYGEDYEGSLPRKEAGSTEPTGNRGYQFEMILRKSINTKAEFYTSALEGETLDPDEEMDRFGAGTSSHGLQYDIGFYKNTAIKNAITRPKSAENLTTKVEVKCFPAQYGSLEKNALKSLIYDGTSLTFEIKPETYFKNKPITRTETQTVFDLMFAQPNTKTFLSKINRLYGITGSQDWAGNSLETIAGAEKVAEVKPTNPRGSHSGEAVAISGPDWVSHMGRKKDLLVIGDLSTFPKSQGTVFALNDKMVAKGFPLWAPSFNFLIKPKMKNASSGHSLSFELTAPNMDYSTVSVGGIAFDDDDPTKPDLYSLLMLSTGGFEEAEIPDVQSLESIFVQDIPEDKGPGILDVLSVSTNRVGGVTSRVADLAAKDLELAHRKRKYSILAKLLGKK